MAYRLLQHENARPHISLQTIRTITKWVFNSYFFQNVKLKECPEIHWSVSKVQPFHAGLQSKTSHNGCEFSIVCQLMKSKLCACCQYRAHKKISLNSAAAAFCQPQSQLYSHPQIRSKIEVLPTICRSVILISDQAGNTKSSWLKITNRDIRHKTELTT